ncbi:MAG: M14 family metallopeptidase [bacterium]
MPSPKVENIYPIEISPPDISPYKNGNVGIDYITCFDSNIPGPHVMISAVVHGNELCGAIALDWLFQNNVQPVRGKLSLGFMNVEAFYSFDPQSPTESRFIDEDFNRLWLPAVLDSQRSSLELERARKVRPWIDTVDLLLDIHSMQNLTPPLMMAGPLPKGRELASTVSIPELVVSDAGHAAGRRMRDYKDFTDPESSRNALLVECGQHWEKAAAPRAIETALRFLQVTGTITPEFGQNFIADRPNPLPQRFIEVTDAVTIQTSAFQFVENYIGMEVIPKAGSVLARDGDKEIQTPYDDCILIMPSRRLNPGATAVRLGRFQDSPKLSV